MSKKDADQLRKALVSHLRGSDLGVEKRGGHWHVVNADGKTIYSFAGTPSDHHFRRNVISDLRRLGIIGKDFR